MPNRVKNNIKLNGASVMRLQKDHTCAGQGYILIEADTFGDAGRSFAPALATEKLALEHSSLQQGPESAPQPRDDVDRARYPAAQNTWLAHYTHTLRQNYTGLTLQSTKLEKSMMRLVCIISRTS